MALGDGNTLHVNTISAEDMMPGEIRMMRWVFLGLLLAGVVLAETLLTAMAAIGAGIAGLAAAGRLFGDREPMLQNVTFPWEAGAAGVAAGLIAGVLGGPVPAARAARIPIATVMRA